MKVRVLLCREIGSLEGRIWSRGFSRELEVRELASRVIGDWRDKMWD